MQTLITLCYCQNSRRATDGVRAGDLAPAGTRLVTPGLRGMRKNNWIYALYRWQRNQELSRSICTEEYMVKYYNVLKSMQTLSLCFVLVVYCVTINFAARCAACKLCLTWLQPCSLDALYLQDFSIPTAAPLPWKTNFALAESILRRKTFSGKAGGNAEKTKRTVCNIISLL